MSRCLVLLALLLVAYSTTARSENPASFTIAPGRVTEAEAVLEADGQAELRMYLTAEKRKEFADFTKLYLEKQVEIVVAGKPFGPMTIKNVILGGPTSFSCSLPEEAFTLAKALMAK